MRVAFLFPGQGSQSLGMLASLAAASEVVTQTFAQASATLGYDLWKLVQEGPPEELNRTEHTQPAMLAAGVATWRFWRQAGGQTPAIVCGHSLGEFTALVCAEALDFNTAVELVAFRAHAMQEAVPEGRGAIVAILGLDEAQVEAACREAAQGAIVEAVNFNGPNQVVIAGDRDAVQRAVEVAIARGAKRAVPLPVSVPSHSSLMQPAARRLSERLAGVDVKPPRIAFMSAVDAVAHSQPDDIRALLGRQLASPVHWTQTVRTIVATGVQALIECGPGKVLTGLNRRIERRANLPCVALEDPAAVESALSMSVGALHA
jgi:[acyl-carrier-protein] S-malonyltransferase